MDGILWFLVIGAIAGWLAGLVMQGRGFGVLGNIIVGIVGAVVGGWLFSAMGVTAYGTAGAIVMAMVGAIVLLGIIGLIKHA
jgi:uncharacterized membrane protein YeaQ/YmgE (transglycosylase-associated protein family)